MSTTEAMKRHVEIHSRRLGIVNEHPLLGEVVALDCCDRAVVVKRSTVDHHRLTTGDRRGHSPGGGEPFDVAAPGDSCRPHRRWFRRRRHDKTGFVGRYQPSDLEVCPCDRLAV